MLPYRPVISNCGYYMENISTFLDFHLQPLAQAVKSYIKNTNEFLNNLRSLPKLPCNITLLILCTVDVVGLYPNIPHEEGLSAYRKLLDNRMEKHIISDTLCDLAEVVLKNNIFKFDEKALIQKRRTAIGIKFAPPYSVVFMAKLEKEILRKAEFNLYLWWRHIHDIFFLWVHGEEKLKSFEDSINKMQPTVKFTAEWSKTVNFVDVTASITEGIIDDLYDKPTDNQLGNIQKVRSLKIPTF